MKNMKNICCIVIPIHSLNIQQHESASIMQTIDILNDYDIFIVCPNKLDASIFSNVVNIKKFDDKWFDSYGAYNRFCLQRMFYDSFSQYKYMLLAQTDAWIFKNELQMWCNKEYDYIGAPWCHYCHDIMKCNYVEKPKDNKPIIGNGGLSLRKISKFIEVTQMIDDDKLLDKYEISKTPNEDLFFMEYSKANWKVPKCSEALLFSHEGISPYHIQHGYTTPFGYHNVLKMYPQFAYFLHFASNVAKNNKKLCKLQIN